MFIGMSGCLLPQLFSALLACLRTKTAPEDTTEPLLQEEAEQPAEDAPPVKQKLTGLRGLLVLGAPTVRAVVCALPALCRLTLPSASQVADLAATTLSNIGLIYITVSVYQMLRGAVIVWNTLFGVVFLGKRLNGLHYTGLTLAMVGIVVVGAASLLAERDMRNGLAPAPAPAPSSPALPPTPPPQFGGFSMRAALSPHARAAALGAEDPEAAGVKWVVAGMAMIVVSQSIQAAGMTMEEFVLRKYDLSSTQLVGYEGAVGAALMLGLFLPVMYCLPGHDVGGRYENSLDTAYMIFHTPVIGGLLAIDLLAINLFNAAGMRITSSLGAVFRSVLEAVRTLNVWLLDLALYYHFTNGRLGEPWSPTWSWLQAFGFAILVSSALTYGKGNMRAAKLAAQGEAEEEDAEAPAVDEAATATDAAAPTTPAPASAGEPSTPTSASSAGLPPLGRSIPRRRPSVGDNASPRSIPRGGSASSQRLQSLLGTGAATVGSPMVAGRHFADFQG